MTSGAVQLWHGRVLKSKGRIATGQKCCCTREAGYLFGCCQWQTDPAYGCLTNGYCYWTIDLGPGGWTNKNWGGGVSCGCPYVAGEWDVDAVNVQLGCIWCLSPHSFGSCDNVPTLCTGSYGRHQTAEVLLELVLDSGIAPGFEEVFFRVQADTFTVIPELPSNGQGNMAQWETTHVLSTDWDGDCSHWLDPVTGKMTLTKTYDSIHPSSTDVACFGSMPASVTAWPKPI